LGERAKTIAAVAAVLGHALAGCPGKRLEGLWRGRARKVAIRLWSHTRPSAAQLAPFMLLSSGRLSAPHRSFAILRQSAIGQKPGQAGREQVPRGSGAVDMPGPCRPPMQLMPGRSRTERRSCGGCAGRMQFRRRKATVRSVSGTWIADAKADVATSARSTHCGSRP
jgi:hypothetical protein